jgi:hypothetical protein
LVVISIIGILLAIVVPAAMVGREKARQRYCANNLRQLGLATHDFKKGDRFPGWQEIVARDASLPIEFPSALPGATTNKIASWPVVLLPYIEEKQLYDLWNDHSEPKYVPDPLGNPALNSMLAHYIPEYACPSRESRFHDGPFISYVANAGYYPLPSDPAPLNNAASKGLPTPGFDYWDAQAGHNGVFVDRVPIPSSAGSLKPHQPLRLPKVTMSDLSRGDGASNTLLYSESLVAGHWSQPGLDTTFVWLYATEPACPPSAGKPMPTIGVTPEMRIHGPKKKVTVLNPRTARPSSRHHHGVNAVFADGHVAFIRDRVDYHVYQQLMTPNGSKSEMPCPGYLLQTGDYEY